MKKTITVTIEAEICDLCDQRAYVARICRGCKKEMCSSCSDLFMVTYARAVYFEGPDVLYCVQCDQALCETQRDPLHRAVTTIRELREEYARDGVAFQARVKLAEQAVGALLSE